MNEDLVEDLIEELVEDLLEDLVEDLAFCLLYKFSWYSDFIDSEIEQLYYLGYLQAEFVMTLVSPPLAGEDGLECVVAGPAVLSGNIAILEYGMALGKMS